MIKIGTIFEMPLMDNQKAYGQYVHKDKMGPIIQVYKLITKVRPSIEAITDSNLMFPPVITGLFAAIKTGFWIPIGFSEVKEFIYPGFVSTFENEKTGEAGIWFYWDGEKSIRLGERLPKKYKEKEFLMVWDPHDVVHRIETGEYPFPYRELILHNKFIPRER